MPWEHCGQPVLDDAACPACGLSKAAWTVEWDRTRSFVVKKSAAGREHIRLLAIDGVDRPVAGEPFAVELPGGQVVEGELDEYGTAKVAASRAGRATVRFPRRDPLEQWALPADGPAPSMERTAAGLVFHCATDPSRQHRFRLVERSPHRGRCAWDRRRALHGQRVGLGLKAEGAAPAHARFAVFVEPVAAPITLLPGARHAGLLVAHAPAAWEGSKATHDRVARCRFRALDSEGRPIDESPPLLVLAHRTVQV